MAKSRSQQRREAVQKEAEKAKAEPKKPAPPAKKTVRLKLRQRDFVRGKLCEADSVHEFSPEEAKHRLETTEKWTQA